MKASFERLDYLSDSGLHVDDLILGMLKRLWKTNAPSQVLLCGWKLMLNQSPTRDGQAKKGV